MLLKMNFQLKKLYQYIVTILAFKKWKVSLILTFDLPKPTASYSNKIIKSLDTNKATRQDGTHAKFVQMSASVIDCHLSNITACDIKK